MTLIEILVSVFILALIATGIGSLFISGERWALHSRSSMAGGELGKHFLDPLQMQVRQDTWNNAAVNCLGTGNCPNQTLGIAEGLGRNYTAVYSVSNNTPIANLNRVVVNITWTEPVLPP